MSRNLSWFDVSELRHLLHAVGAPDRRRGSSLFDEGDVPSTLSGNYITTDRFSHIATQDPGRFASAASTQPGPPQAQVPFDKKATRFSAGTTPGDERPSTPNPAPNPTMRGRPKAPRTMDRLQGRLDDGTEWGGSAALRDQWDAAERASTGMDERRPSSIAADSGEGPASSGQPPSDPVDAPLAARRPSTDPPPPPESVRAAALPFESDAAPSAGSSAGAPVEEPAEEEPMAPPPFQLPDGSMEEQLAAFVEWARSASGFGGVALLDGQGLPLAVGGDWHGDDAFGFAFASTFGRATGLLSEIGRPPEAGHIASTHQAHRFAASWTMVGRKGWWLVLRGDLQAEPSRAVAVGEAFHNLIGIMTSPVSPDDA